MRWLRDLPVDFVQGDLFNADSLSACVKDADYIIHLAGVTKAKHKRDFYSGNVETTQNLLRAARQVPRLKKFCYVSSLTAAGPSATGIPGNEQDPCHPITTYGKSKLEAEHLCAKYRSEIPLVIIRPPAVFGPRDSDILEFFKWVKFGLKPVIGSLSKTLSIVYAPDLAKGIIRATMDDRTAGETYNIADPLIYRFSSIIDQLATYNHKRSIVIYLPKGVVYCMAGITQVLSYVGKNPAVLNIEKARDLLQPHWVCSPQKIKDHIGFQAPTSLSDAMNITLPLVQRKWLVIK